VVISDNIEDREQKIEANYNASVLEETKQTRAKRQYGPTGGRKNKISGKEKG